MDREDRERKREEREALTRHRCALFLDLMDDSYRKDGVGIVDISGKPAHVPKQLSARGKDEGQRQVRDLPLRDDWSAWKRVEVDQERAAKRHAYKQPPASDAVIIRTYETARVPEKGTSTIDRAIALIRKIAWRAITETILGHKPGPLRLTYVPRIRKSQPTVPALPRVIRL